MIRLLIILSLLLSAIIVNPSQSYAAAVRIADDGAYKLVQNMRSIVYGLNKEMVNIAPYNITDVVRATHLDKQYKGYAGYMSKVVEKDTNKEKTFIFLYVNSQGYVSRANIRFCDFNDSQANGMTLSVTLMALGVQQDEYMLFYKKFRNKMQSAKSSGNSKVNFTDNIYCKAKKRYFNIHMYECENGHHHIDITGSI